MTFREIPIEPKQIRSFRDYPRLLEDQGCPRCNSFLIGVKVRNFSQALLRFECTCQNCGLYYFAKEEKSESGKRLILYEEAEEDT